MADVVYIRCSTRRQATGDSLMRQLDACISFARANGIIVGWVFCDIGSGASHLPNRAAAISVAKKMKCNILVESIDRWDRGGANGSEASEFHLDGRVMQCSKQARDFASRIDFHISEFATHLLKSYHATEAVHGTRP